MAGNQTQHVVHGWEITFSDAVPETGFLRIGNELTTNPCNLERLGSPEAVLREITDCLFDAMTRS